jgi:FkbM family methyltransferase
MDPRISEAPSRLITGVWNRRPIIKHCGVRLDRRDPHIRGLVDAALRAGLYERREITAVTTITEAHDRVMEVGAGLGIVTTLAAQRASHVTAFEANPAMRKTLERTFALNGVSPDLRMQPVAAEAGNVYIAVDELFWTSRVAEAGVAVEAVPFQSVLDEIHPSFLILDGEGIEGELLADPLPPYVLKLVVEVHEDVIGDAGCREIMASLTGQGFSLRGDLTEGNVWVLQRGTR